MRMLIEFEKDGAIHIVECKGFTVMSRWKNGVEVRLMQLKPHRGKYLKHEYIKLECLVGAVLML